ncbi:unnamed protein product [Ectocarpus sp. 8 AP-2014]
MATPQQQWPVDVGRWAPEEERGLGMTRTAWWWQAGPVASCCGCFTIRTGIYLLSLWNMFWGMVYINFENWTIPAIIQRLRRLRSAYTKDCTGVIVTQEHDCDAYLSAMDQGERTLDFSQSMVPAYHAIGALYMLLSLAGWRAGYTNNTTLAKLFMLGFPVTFSIDVCHSFLSPNDEAPLNTLLAALFSAYFFKVAWSFYRRLRISEEAQRIVAEGGLEGGRRGVLDGRSSAAAGTVDPTGVQLGTMIA